MELWRISFRENIDFFLFFFRAESDASLVEWTNPSSQQAVRVLIFRACLVTGLYALHKLFGQKLCHFTFNQQKSAQPRQNRKLSNLVKWVAQFFTSLLSSKDFLSLLFKCKLSHVPGLRRGIEWKKSQTDWRPGWLSGSIFPHARVLFLTSWLEKLGLWECWARTATYSSCCPVAKTKRSNDSQENQ